MRPLHPSAALALTVNLDEVLAERAGSAPAPAPAPRRRGRRQPAGPAAVRARHLPPPVRNLPRRGGY